MTAALMTPPRARFFDNNGLPLAGGQIFTYIAGTTTPQASYTNQSGSTPNANPVILDASGSADIWLSGSYKIVVEDVNGNVISTTDNITAFSTGAAGATFLDGSFTLQNTSDPTKQVVFNLGAVASGNIVTISVPNGNFTLIDPALPQTYTAAQRQAIVTLTSGPTITPDFSLGNNFQVQLTSNAAIANPVNIVSGQSGNFIIYQDATGSRIPTWAWGWMNPGGSLPSLQTSGGAVDTLKYTVTAFNSGVVTISLATPGVVTFTNHGFLLGQPIQITTTGALPTGLSVSTTYYVVPANANSFSLATSLANAAAGTTIATSGSQSGVHTLTGITIALTTPRISSSGGYRSLASTDTVVAGDNGKILTISGTCALALSSASSIGAFSCYVQNVATTGIQIITITPNGTDNIDGANSTLIILPGETRLLNCNATAWLTQVVVPFTITVTSTAAPTLPRNGYTGLYGQLWGGGGSGGAGATDGGGGGGGGAYNQFTYMGATASLAMSLTVGAGGASQTSANTAGSAGGTTFVEDTTNTRFFAFAYGGGAGGGSSLGAGGGGGGTGNNAAGAPNANGTPNATGVGTNAATSTAGAGGADAISGTGGGVAGGGSSQNYAGGGGGNSSTKLGGWTYYGGAGGGCAVATTGGAGGQSVWGGGGGGGASNTTAGTGGVSTFGGSGGAGAPSGAATGGTVPAGGGGGTVGTGGSGAGASGKIILQGII